MSDFAEVFAPYAMKPADFSFGIPGFASPPPIGNAGQLTGTMPWPTGNIPGVTLPTPQGMGALSGWGKANVALQGLATIGQLWGSMKMLNLAKKQFKFQKEFANANLANQIKSYNTALSDRARSRGFTEGQSQQQISSYVDENRLSR